MSENVLLLSTWYPAHQEERGLQCSWAIADIVAELRKHSVSTVVVAARSQNHTITVDCVNGQKVISIPSYLVIRHGLVRKWFARSKNRELGNRQSNHREWACQCEGSVTDASGNADRETKATPAAAGSSTGLHSAEFWKKLIGFIAEQVHRPWLMAKLSAMLENSGRFDRVIIHGRVAQHLEFVRRFRTGPVSVCFHETDYHERSTADLLKLAGARIRRVAFRSERLRERFVQGGMIEPGIPYLVVPSGVPAASVKARSEYKTKVPGTLKLVCVSSMIPRKKLRSLIETLACIESFEWSLDLFGDGPLRAELESQVITLGLERRIIFHGFVSHHELMQRYSAYDVFILLSESETFGMVYTEALSQGLFVVGSRGEGIDGILMDGVNGFLVSPGEPVFLLKTLESINRFSQEEEARFKDRIYESMRHLTIEGIAAKYRDFMIKD